MNPQERLTQIYVKLVKILQQDIVAVCNIVVGTEWQQGNDEIGILNDLYTDAWNISGRYCLTDNIINADILIIYAIGNNHKNLRIYLEERGFKGIICFWLYDNHISHENNKASVIEGDIYFCSHYGQEHEQYLLNEQSISGPTIPLSHKNHLLDNVFFSRYSEIPRLSKVVAPYFIYNFPMPRTKFLYDLQVNHPEFVCLFTQAEDRQKYFHNALTDEEKAARWFLFKSSIIVPINRDLSNRVFDGLFWGHTLLVPIDLPAFDYVFSEADQRRLGIIRYDALGGSEAIRAAAREVLRFFDEAGQGGIVMRHDYVVSGHLIEHRIAAILRFLEDFAAGKIITDLLIGDGISGLRSHRN